MKIIRLSNAVLLLCAVAVAPLAAQVPKIVSGSVDSSLATIAIPDIRTDEAAQRLTNALDAIARQQTTTAAPEVNADRQVMEDAAIPFIRWLGSIGVGSFDDLESAADLFEFVASQAAGDLARAGYHESAGAVRRRKTELRELEIVRRWANAISAGREVAILGNSISLLGMARSRQSTEAGDGDATLIIRQPAGTDVFVNGRVRGAVPTEIEVPAGDVDVAFRSESQLFSGQIASVQPEDRLLLQPSGVPAGTTRITDGLPAGQLVVLEGEENGRAFLGGQRTATLPVGDYEARIVSIGLTVTSESVGALSIVEGTVAPVDVDAAVAPVEVTIENAPEGLEIARRGYAVEQLADGRQSVRPDPEVADSVIVSLPVGTHRGIVVVPIRGNDSSRVDLSPMEILIGPIPTFSTIRIARMEIASFDDDGENLSIEENEDAGTWSARVTLPRGTYQVFLKGPTHESQRIVAQRSGADGTVNLMPELSPRPALEVGLSLSDRRAVLPNTEYYVRISEVDVSDGDENSEQLEGEWKGAVGAGFSPLVTSLPGENVRLVVGLTDDPEPVFDDQIKIDAGELRVVPVELAFSNRYLLSQLEARKNEVANELEVPLQRREKQVRRTRVWGGIAVGLAVLTGVFYFNGLGHRSDYDSADTTAARAEAYDSLRQARLWSLIGSAATFGAGTVAVTNWASRPDIEDMEQRRDALDAEIARIQEEM